MNAKTLKALKASIEHWRENATREDVENIKIGPAQCALCKLFCRKDTPLNDRCVGCPVAERTGSHGCYFSPYEDVEKALWKIIQGPEERRGRDLAKLRRACEAEFAFLVSLLPSTDKGAQP